MLDTVVNTHRFAVTDALVGPVALLLKEELIVWSNVGNRFYFGPRECGLRSFVALGVHKEGME